MPPLILQILIAVIGIGVFKAALERYTDWSDAAQWSLTILSIIVVTVWSYLYSAYPTWPRHLARWQKQALLTGCRHIDHSVRIYVGSSQTNLNATDYSREFMKMFNSCHLSAAYGYDPFPRDTVVNGKMIIVPPDNDFLLRIVGVELWAVDPRHPPEGVRQLSETLDSAGISFTWMPDPRLAGIAVGGSFRFLISEPQAILFIGQKPPWSLRDFLFTERRHLSWCFANIRTSLTPAVETGRTSFEEIPVSFARAGMI